MVRRWCVIRKPRDISSACNLSGASVWGRGMANVILLVDIELQLYRKDPRVWSVRRRTEHHAVTEYVAQSASTGEKGVQLPFIFSFTLCASFSISSAFLMTSRESVFSVLLSTFSLSWVASSRSLSVSR